MKAKIIVGASITVIIIGGIVLGLIYFFNQGYANRLISAIKENDISGLEQILGQPGNVDSRPYLLEFDNRTNYPALHLACHLGNLQAVEILVNQGADINNINATNKTSPLLASLRNNELRLEIATFLIERGADINYRNLQNYTALGLALSLNTNPFDIIQEQKEYEFAKYLINKGAAFDQVDGFGHLIFSAASCNNVLLLKYLIEVENVDVNLQNIKKYTPLMVAARGNCKESVEYLVNNEAETNITNFEGKTALDLAVEYNCQETILLLSK